MTAEEKKRASGKEVLVQMRTGETIGGTLLPMNSHDKYIKLELRGGNRFGTDYIIIPWSNIRHVCYNRT